MNYDREEYAYAVDVVEGLYEHLYQTIDHIPADWPSSKSHLLGIAIWDIFSNNHTVLSPRDKEVDIGSWRGSGSTIADLINRAGYEKEAYGYLDFYMGSFLHADEAVDLSRLYNSVFTFLKARGFEWLYSVPAIYTFHPNPDRASDEKGAIDQQIAAINEELAESVLSNIPHVVRSYHRVYGKLPGGYDF